MAKRLPYIQVATFCENAVNDPQKGLIITKLLDTLSVPALQDSQIGKVSVPVAFSFKSKHPLDNCSFELLINTPSGKKISASKFNLIFPGGEKGPCMVARMDVPVEGEGEYWIDVVTSGVILTRMPLRIVFR